jgi:hypothetical protein
MSNVFHEQPGLMTDIVALNATAAFTSQSNPSPKEGEGQGNILCELTDNYTGTVFARGYGTTEGEAVITAIAKGRTVPRNAPMDSQQQIFDLTSELATAKAELAKLKLGTKAPPVPVKAAAAKGSTPPKPTKEEMDAEFGPDK